MRTWATGFWEGVAQKNRRQVCYTIKIRDLPLQVFEAGSKVAQKIVREPMLHGINFLRNIVALNCESSLVTSPLLTKS